MTDSERVSELKKLHERIQEGGLRPMDERLEILGRVCGLLAFSPMHQANAMQSADVLSQPGFSSSMYQRMEGRLITILGHAITELEHPLPTPPPEPPARDTVQLPLSSEHTLLWFWHHCHYSVRWVAIGLVASSALALAGFGFWLGQQRIPSQIHDIFTDTHPTTLPTTTPKANENKTDTTK
jgi:hypothetical protein